MQQCLHVKNISKYHPGYEHRQMMWCKIYFTILNGDGEFEMIPEIDKWRFLAFLIIELQGKKPVMLDENFLMRKGFDFSKRTLQETLSSLAKFVELVSHDSTRHKQIEDNIKHKETDATQDVAVKEFMEYFNMRTGKRLTLSTMRASIIAGRLQEHTMQELKTCVDNFIKDTWSDRHKFCDVVYCIGVHNKKDNLERWLNVHARPRQPYNPDIHGDIRNLSK